MVQTGLGDSNTVSVVHSPQLLSSFDSATTPFTGIREGVLSAQART